MASIFPFNTVSIDDSIIGPEFFVQGRGVLLCSGSDRVFVGPSGEIKLLRTAVLHKASFQTHGKHPELSTESSLGAAISISCGSTLLASFSGLVSASYDAAKNTTTFIISGIIYE
ncbi:MAG: hypothetical protein A2X49_06610 [Lentisphaerae bacterium GWF2_52_8]|nr:MAG: hypothetical protein A2X49_06610 [Lentisphaerae bacterium GWF2_52_8]